MLHCGAEGIPVHVCAHCRPRKGGVEVRERTLAMALASSSRAKPQGSGVLCTCKAAAVAEQPCKQALAFAGAEERVCVVPSPFPHKQP